MLDEKKLLTKILGRLTLDYTHPVGSYYETYDTSFDPNVFWGGTWYLETAGMVHVSAGTGYNISGALNNTQDGGSPYIQDHTHGFTNPTVPQHGHGFTQPYTSSDGAHGHSVRALHYVSGAATTNANVSSGGRYLNEDIATNNTSSNHNHTIQGGAVHDAGAFSTTGGAVGTINTSGLNVGNANNMQPYIIVNRWYRYA